MYGGLSDEIGDIDERLEVLTNVKWTCEEFPCALTRDIVELCDREADLLNRGKVSRVHGQPATTTDVIVQAVRGHARVQGPPKVPDRLLKVPGVRLMNTALAAHLRNRVQGWARGRCSDNWRSF